MRSMRGGKRVFLLTLAAILGLGLLGGVARAGGSSAGQTRTAHVRPKAPHVEVRWGVYVPCNCSRTGETSVIVYVGNSPFGAQTWSEPGEYTYPILHKIVDPTVYGLCSLPSPTCSVVTKPHRLRVP